MKRHQFQFRSLDESLQPTQALPGRWCRFSKSLAADVFEVLVHLVAFLCEHRFRRVFCLQCACLYTWTPWSYCLWSCTFSFRFHAAARCCPLVVSPLFINLTFGKQQHSQRLRRPDHVYQLCILRSNVTSCQTSVSVSRRLCSFRSTFTHFSPASRWSFFRAYPY